MQAVRSLHTNDTAKVATFDLAPAASEPDGPRSLRAVVPPAVRRRPPARLLIAAAIVVVTLVALLVAVLHSDNPPRRLVPAGGDTSSTFDPLAWSGDRHAAFERAAAAGAAHVLFARSPGGAVATAARVARWRPVLERAARGAPVDADALEGLVFLESAGRADAVAGTDVRVAAGLTQIVAETGIDLLGMRIDVAHSQRLTRAIARAERRGQTRRTRRLLAARRRADPRFDPPRALAATVRYLKIARNALGRDDLALESYHMGIGNLQTALRRYGSKDVSYAQLYFDSTPLHHASAHRWLAALGDDSANYLWKLRAAEAVMRLWRSDPAQLRRLAELHQAKNSAEEVLHPRAVTEVFGSPADLKKAWDAGDIVPLPNQPRRLGFGIDPGMGELSGLVGQRPTLYRGLRPGARAMLAYLAAGVRAIAGGPAALRVTSSVRDAAYQRHLLARDPEATANYSLHTTGWAFDIGRRYASRRQALAFQFMLDRLSIVNLIAWVREPGAIHVTVSGGAPRALQDGL